jgi:hypothetical protein
VVFLPSAALMLTWNQQVTGSSWKMPYQAHIEQYEVYLPFLFLPPRPEPVYRYAPMRELYVTISGDAWLGQQTAAGWRAQAWDKLRRLSAFFLNPVLGGLFVVLPWLLCRRWLWFALATVGLLLGVLLVAETWAFSHYAAPATGLLYLLPSWCLERLAVCRWRRVRVGWWVMAAVVVAGLLVPGYNLLCNPVKRPGQDFGAARAAVAAKLEKDGERHLVFVHYAEDHEAHWEWVYNRADIDAARVVWAREVEEPLRGRLLKYYQGRRVWRLYADEEPPRLEEWTTESGKRATSSPE